VPLLLFTLALLAFGRQRFFPSLAVLSPGRVQVNFAIPSKGCSEAGELHSSFAAAHKACAARQPTLGKEYAPCLSIKILHYGRSILMLPDPPPEALRQVNDLVILTAISGLSQRLSPELGNELSKAVPSITARLKTAA
jgi:hypothetical protein